MWVSFPGLRGWWRSRAEKCSQSSRGEAGHSWLRGRAVEAPVCGVRAFSLTSCWGSGCWWWWAQAPTWGPQGLRKGSIRPGAQGTAPMLEASGGEIPWCDPEAVPDRLEWLPGHSLSLAATPPPLSVCATATALRHVPTWLRSVSASSILSADPQGCALVCLTSPGQPWPRSVALCHLLSTDVITCWTRRSSRAPGILPLKWVRLSAQSPAGCRACTARPLWGAGGGGWKRGCHCCPRCARLVSLAPCPSPLGPLRGFPHQNFRADPLRPSWTEHGESFGLAAGAVGRPARGDRRPPSSPRGVSPPFTPCPVRQEPFAHLGFPGGALVKNQPAKAGSCKRCKFDPWVWEIPWRRKWQPSLVLLPGKSLGQRSLVGCSPWGSSQRGGCDWAHAHIHMRKIIES